MRSIELSQPRISFSRQHFSSPSESHFSPSSLRFHGKPQVSMRKSLWVAAFLALSVFIGDKMGVSIPGLNPPSYEIDQAPTQYTYKIIDPHICPNKYDVRFVQRLHTDTSNQVHSLDLTLQIQLESINPSKQLDADVLTHQPELKQQLETLIEQKVRHPMVSNIQAAIKKVGAMEILDDGYGNGSRALDINRMHTWRRNEVILYGQIKDMGEDDEKAIPAGQELIGKEIGIIGNSKGQYKVTFLTALSDYRGIKIDPKANDPYFESWPRKLQQWIDQLSPSRYFNKGK